MRTQTSTTRRAGRPGRIARRTVLTALTVSGVAAALSVGPSAAARPVGRPAAATPLAAPAAAAPRAAAAAGRLGPRNCVEGSGTASCDLYAMTGTTSVNGTGEPIWGFSTTGATGSATAPGPVLVVRQHDQVTLTLHNNLAEAVSLAFPGQIGVRANGTAGDDRVGSSAGGTRTYTFTADRAGTFLYEAGHTADGDRQVAMGLAGALVVLPGDNTAYGTAATAYDDEAVLVLSEIDPKLNADPAHFDMRNFHPAYRLINGKAFPGTDPIATDQNHTVLLRYVNAGAETHPMGLLGGTQLEIAQDGHPAAFATRLAAESVDPGATVDTLVTMPNGPEAKFAVYDTSQHLDNNGQTGADELQVAFGGMLTFLDTNAPPPSTDGVGPVSAHVSASPNPSDALADVTISADFSDATTGNSAIDQAEFVVDDAVTTGVGFGVPMTGTFGAVDVNGATGTIPVGAGDDCTAVPTPVSLTCLAAGKHKIYVRAHDVQGNWGAIGSVVFNLPKTGPATTNGSADSPANGSADVVLTATGDDSDAGGKIVAAEYFVDTAGTDGSGTAMTINRSATIVSEDATLSATSVAALPEGLHHLLVHSKDSLGLWGPPLDVELDVDKTGPTVDAVSIGPNPANGVLSDPSNPGYAVISGQLTDRDSGGATQNNVVSAEAFIDNVKGPGTGLQLLAVDGKLDSNSEKVYGLVPLSQIKALGNGAHTVYLRGLDDAGNWGDVLATQLVVDKVAPVLSNMTANPNPTNGAANVTVTANFADSGLIQAAEYWFGTTDPGVGKATVTQPSTIAAGTVQVTIPLAGLPSGAQTLNLRVKDQAGNWSTKASLTLTVVPPNRIFADTFEPGGPNWSSTTGTVQNATAARLPTSWEPGSTQGMRVTMPAFGNNRTAYRTDTSPMAESTYHVRFAFNRSTLGVGASTPTLFRARTAANGTVFSLQYRLSGGTAQVRVVLNGNTGSVTGNWYSLTAGSNQIQLDWVSSTNGSLALVLNGTTVQVLNRNNANLRVDTVDLGVVTGAGAATGAAYFDSFSSGRITAA